MVQLSKEKIPYQRSGVITVLRFFLMLSINCLALAKEKSGCGNVAAICYAVKEVSPAFTDS